MRLGSRGLDQLRDVKIERGYTRYAEGSVLIEFGATKVLCTASIEEEVPRFLKNTKTGWVSAEYSMLPRATHSRSKREAVAGKVSPRSSEISRLIGRSLRSCVDLSLLGERQILIDCDVLQADGGTRTASITGAFVALYDAINVLITEKIITINPIKHFLAAISIGVYHDQVLLDLDYHEDSNCDTDLNLVMLENSKIVEIQGTAEGKAFSRSIMNQMLDVGELGIKQLILEQKRALGLA